MERLEHPREHYEVVVVDNASDPATAALVEARDRARYGDCLVTGHWHFSPRTIEALRRTPFGRYRSATVSSPKTSKKLRQ